MTFLDFSKVKNYENMLQNAPNCTIKKKISVKHDAYPPPPSKREAMPRVVSPPSK